jgi:two-component system KDP operon response regulator KdpE
MNVKVLLIDDDASLGEAIRFMLTKKGFHVEVAHSAMAGLKKWYNLKPDAVILDIMLPDMDGFELCRRLREMSGVPIIMLTALGSEKNLVDALDLGADDYIVKPVTVEILTARIRAVLRRTEGRKRNGNGRKPVFVCDGLIIDFDKRQVMIEGEPIHLSPTEYRLLSVMAKHKGRMLPHEFLLTEVWGPDYAHEADYLRLYVSYLRHKIEKNPSQPNLIHNEWGVGYRFG